jgi:hypothetical protein
MPLQGHKRVARTEICFFMFYVFIHFVRVWAGFIWLRVGSNVVVLWIRQCTFGFHKRRGIYWPAEWRTGSEGLCSMAYVIEVFTYFVQLRLSGMSRIECCKLSNVSADIAVAIFRANLKWLGFHHPFSSSTSSSPACRLWLLYPDRLLLWSCHFATRSPLAAATRNTFPRQLQTNFENFPNYCCISHDCRLTGYFI